MRGNVFHAHWDVDTARRLMFALALSALLHGALILAIRAGPPNARAGAGRPIEARIAPLDLEATSAGVFSAGAPVVGRTIFGDSMTVAASDAPLVGESIFPVHTPERVAKTPSREAAVAVVSAPAPDPAYYLITSLDRPPLPLTKPDACYPQGANGEVAYELLIDEAGVVQQASVLAVKPIGLFIAAAVELCRALKFSPAIKDGRAVRSKVRFVVGPA